MLVLNPGGEGGIPTSLRWDLLQDCHTAQGAIGRAGYLMAAAPKASGGKDAWWDARGAELLRIMLHAAAISGATMREADRWVRDPLAGEPRSILAMPGAAAGWLEKLEALTASDSDQLRGITASAAGALAWMDDPHMASVACPERDDFDAWDFLTSNGTVYLIGTDKPHNSAAPFFACFTAHLFDTAKLIASASPGGRLDPPLGLVIDEPRSPARSRSRSGRRKPAATASPWSPDSSPPPSSPAGGAPTAAGRSATTPPSSSSWAATRTPPSWRPCPRCAACGTPGTR